MHTSLTNSTSTIMSSGSLASSLQFGPCKTRRTKIFQTERTKIFPNAPYKDFFRAAEVTKKSLYGTRLVQYFQEKRAAYKDFFYVRARKLVHCPSQRNPYSVHPPTSPWRYAFHSTPPLGLDVALLARSTLGSDSSAPCDSSDLSEPASGLGHFVHHLPQTFLLSLFPIPLSQTRGRSWFAIFPRPFLPPFKFGLHLMHRFCHFGIRICHPGARRVNGRLRHNVIEKGGAGRGADNLHPFSDEFCCFPAEGGYFRKAPC